MSWKPHICSRSRLQMLENVDLQKEQWTNHCILTQIARRVMAWWQMDWFFLIPYKEIYRQGQRHGQIHLPALPRVPGTTWAVDWMSLCPDVKEVSAQALFSLSAGLSLHPLKDWINWAASHLGCFPSNKESHVVWKHFGDWERVKSNKKTNSLNQRGMREHAEGHTVTAEQAFHPARLPSCLWAVAWGLSVLRAQTSGNRVGWIGRKAGTLSWHPAS